MALMLDADRIEVRREIGEILSIARQEISINKTELKAAVDAIDQYLSDNAVTINNTLPAIAQANLTKQQKAMLMAYVALRRYNVNI